MPDQPGVGGTTDSPSTTDYAAYEAAQNAADLGRTTTPDVTPDSSPDPSGKQSASTDATDRAASETATPDKTKPPRNLETRHTEVDEKITELKRKLEIKRELEAQLADRQSPAKQTASQPVKPAEPEWKRYATHPDAPKVENFDTYEEYVDARAVFIADQRHSERETHARRDAESRGRMTETDKTIAGFAERAQKAREADPDFESKIAPGLREIHPAFAMPVGKQPGPANYLLQEVVMSEFSNELMVHFSTDEGRAEWHTLISSPNPAAMIRGFGRIEARFEKSSGTPAEGEKPAAKPVTSAPAPPKTLGSKPPVNPDRAGAAVNAGDFSAYAAAADAADLARMRGR